MTTDRTLYVNVYRIGGYPNAKWHAALPVRGLAAASKQARYITNMGYKTLTKSVNEWVKERIANCLLIAKNTPEGLDRDGWLEDAEYFREIHRALETLDEISDPRFTH